MFLAAALCAGCSSGCGALGLSPFPHEPLLVNSLPNGGIERAYDVDGDRRVDYIEQLGADGRVARLKLDTDRDGVFDVDTPWPAVGEDVRDLIIVADSIPWGLVDEAWRAGRLRLFPPPTRTIAPFPVMTDPALAEFFHCSPCIAMEARYCDGTRLVGGMPEYLAEINAPWRAEMDYTLAAIAHGGVYLDPKPWMLHELGCIEKHFRAQSGGKRFAGYMVSTSGLGARFGRSGHEWGLLELDRFCQSLVRETRGRLRITLLSDHGHNLVSSRRVELGEQLRKAGFRVAEELSKPGDVVVPEWGLISCAALYTREPARVAAAVVQAEGVESAVYRENSIVHVVDRDGGHATIKRGDDGRFVCTVLAGDPLGLAECCVSVRQSPDRAAPGAGPTRYVMDRGVALKLLTDSPYPDAIVRAATAFDLFTHPADVFVSLADGYCCGSPGFNGFVGVEAAHGNLGRSGSCGFLVTSAGALPPVLRNADAAAELEKLGVRILRSRRISK